MSIINKKIRKSTDLSRANETKLTILLSVFNRYKTAGEVAKETHHKTPIDAKTHLHRIGNAMARLRWRYPHPYLQHNRLRRPREGGRTAYKASPKGRRMACELTFRKNHGLDLTWKREKVNTKGQIYIGGNYNIECHPHGCRYCQYYPLPRPACISSKTSIQSHTHAPTQSTPHTPVYTETKTIVNLAPRAPGFPINLNGEVWIGIQSTCSTLPEAAKQFKLLGYASEQDFIDKWLEEQGFSKYNEKLLSRKVYILTIGKRYQNTQSCVTLPSDTITSTDQSKSQIAEASKNVV